MIWHKFKFHWTICEVEQSFFILIHKSVENDMGKKSLFVEWAEPVDCLKNLITSLRKWMLNDYKITAQNRAALKVVIMEISILCTFICV